MEGAEYLYNGAVDVVTHVVEVLDSFGKTVAQEAEACEFEIFMFKTCPRLITQALSPIVAAGTVALANSIAKALTQGYTEGGSQ